jgi:hypothetical protein
MALMVHYQMKIQEKFHELSFSTLYHTGEDFIHQHNMDTFAAQIEGITYDALLQE